MYQKDILIINFNIDKILFKFRNNIFHENSVSQRNNIIIKPIM